MPRPPSVLRYYLTAAAAIVLALALPMASVGGVVSFALILAGVFALSSFLRVKQGGVEDMSRSTGDRTLDAVIAQGMKAVEALKRHNALIPGEAVSRDLDRLEGLARDIFAYIKDNPEKMRHVRTFLDYTLPTTLTLLDKRAELERGGAATADTVSRIDGALGHIADAFAATLDKLYADKALDADVEIDVLARMIKRDGLDDPFNLKGGSHP